MSKLLESERDAERAVLGAAMMNQAALALALDACRAEWFGLDAHRLIFKGIEAVSDSGNDVDEVAVASMLGAQPGIGRDTNALQSVGGMVQVLQLTQAAPTVSNVRAYIGAVIEGYRRRTAGALAERLVKVVNDGGSELDIALAEVESGLYDLGRIGLDTKTTYTMLEAIEQMDAMAGSAPSDSDENLRGLVLPFAHRQLNQINGGQRPGNVVVTGGYTSDGKTWDVLWDMQYAAEAIREAGDHGRVVMFQLEMDVEEIAGRLLSMTPELSFKDVMQGASPLADQQKRRDELAALPIDVVTQPLTIGALRAALSRARAERRPIRMFVIDHIGLMKWPGRSPQERRTAMEEGIEQIKSMCREFRCVGHVLTQLNELESSKENPYPPPTLRSIRDSRALTHIGDYVKFVWRERNHNMVTDKGRIIVAKVRNGKPIPPIPVRFDDHWMRFVTASHHPDHTAVKESVEYVAGVGKVRPNTLIESTGQQGLVDGPAVV